MPHPEPAATGLSFEFFPPRSPEAAAKLTTTCRELATLRPDFFSVTYGAGGSTRELTLETVLELHRDTGIDGAPHLSCVGSSTADIRATLERYRAAGITRVVALRGDMPSGTTGLGELRYASELVEFIRSEFGRAMRLEVAAYPEVHPQAAGAKAARDRKPHPYRPPREVVDHESRREERRRRNLEQGSVKTRGMREDVLRVRVLCPIIQ